MKTNPLTVQITPSVRRCEKLASGRPGRRDETVCPTFLAVQRFANWVGQAVSPAGPIFHTFSGSARGRIPPRADACGYIAWQSGINSSRPETVTARQDLCTNT